MFPRMLRKRKFKGLVKGFCLWTLLFGLCISGGCGETADGKSVDENVVDEKASDGENADGEAADEKASGGEMAVPDTEDPLTMMQLLEDGNTNVVEIPDPIFPDTVLWFNATYAPLTYSNGMDWRLPGGLEETYFNGRLTQTILERDWDVVDSESAVETIDWLREEGHRKTYRKYQDELEQLGMLDLDVDVFLDTLVNAEMEGYLYRYVIVYSMYQAGLDEDVMAAWDLCRINQLCGDYYLCGYMTYEEAMDVSLENSLLLQEKYSSWEELMDSYILGYQFWQSDPCLTDDSPTLERYHYYELLLEMEDGPYSLDWNMELKKEW